MISTGAHSNITFKNVQRMFTGASLMESYTMDCSDNATFKDAKGYSCSAWKGYECKTAQQMYQYTAEGQQALVQNCRQTCHLCEHDVDITNTLFSAIESNSLSGLEAGIKFAHQMGILDDDMLMHSATALYTVDRGLDTAMALMNGEGFDIWKTKDELDKAVKMARKLGVARDNAYARNAMELYSVVGTA